MFLVGLMTRLYIMGSLGTGGLIYWRNMENARWMMPPNLSEEIQMRYYYLSRFYAISKASYYGLIFPYPIYMYLTEDNFSTVRYFTPFHGMELSLGHYHKTVNSLIFERKYWENYELICHPYLELDFNPRNPYYQLRFYPK